MQPYWSQRMADREDAIGQVEDALSRDLGLEKVLEALEAAPRRAGDTYDERRTVAGRVIRHQLMRWKNSHRPQSFSFLNRTTKSFIEWAIEENIRFDRQVAAEFLAVDLSAPKLESTAIPR